MPIYSNLTYIGPPRSSTGSRSKFGITLHCTDNDAAAEGEALYAKRRTDGVSSHYYVDGDRVVQSLNTDRGANHAGSPWPNAYCIAYEFCGRAAWSRSRWLSAINWDAAAKQIAVDCQRWKIPARSRTPAQLGSVSLSNRKGINTHNDCRLAFGGTSHTDPGPNFPEAHLIGLVNQILNGDAMVDLSTRIPVAKWILKRFPETGIDGKYSMETVWGSAYGWARVGGENSDKIIIEQAAAKQRELAILAAVSGDSYTKILKKLDALQAAMPNPTVLAQAVADAMDDVELDVQIVAEAIRQVLGSVDEVP